jgi:predicted transposase/invertase (TIGR01784 family)
MVPDTFFDELARKHREGGMAVQVLKRMSLMDRIRMTVEDAEFARGDRKAELNYSYNEGREKGIGLGKVEDARNMKADGLPLEKIAQYTGLSPEQIAQL